jgi:hypothetical protein
MDDGPHRGRWPVLGSWVPAGFDVRRIVLAPGAERLFDEAEWRDAIVVVDSGKIDLECWSGSRRRFRRGDVLWLIGLPLRALHSCGRGPAVLIAVSRHRDELATRSASNVPIAVPGRETKEATQ